MGSKRNKNERNRGDSFVAAPPPSASGSMRALPDLPPANRADSGVAAFVAWLFVAMMMLGYIVFTHENALPYGNMMSRTRALFMVVNSATLTGFQTPFLPVDAYKWIGQWMIFALTITGSLFAWIVGGIAVTRIARLPYSDKQIAITAIGGHLFVLIAGMLVFYRTDQPLLASALQSCSALANSGIWMGTWPTDVLDWRPHLLVFLALLGGFGLPVLMDLFDVIRRKRSLSNHSQAVLTQSIVIYLLATLILFLFRWPTDLLSFRMTLASSSIAAINTRTAGLPVGYASAFPRFLQWILLLLMFIGAAPGGTAGGIKTTTLWRIMTGLRDAFAGRAPGKIFSIAVIWLLSLAALIFLCLLFLLWTDPGEEADHLLFIAASAATNCGLSHDRVGIVGNGMYVLSITMLLGRILPILLLWWVVKHSDETDVAIG